MSRGGLRVLIVDDERPARQKVRRLLTADPEVETIFEARDGVGAVELIRVESPDVVFLDVQMPGLDGFGVVDALGPDVRPHLVFVTAFDAYAVQAFDVHAVDYLVKPFDAERFCRALGRAKQAIAERRGREEGDRVRQLLAEVHRHRPERPDRILVEHAGRAVLLPLVKVDRLEAVRNYVTVHAATERYRVRSTLTHLERRLDPARFVRVNRSTIVNVDRITELQPWTHGDYVVLLTDGVKLRLTRRYRARLDHFDPGARNE
jgi:two-component system, LytTR family, response regulator